MLHAIGIGIGAVDGHVIAEQAVAADVLEACLSLCHGQLILIFLLQRQTHAAGAHAEGRIVVELGRIAMLDVDRNMLHRFSSFHRPALAQSNTKI